MSTPPAPRVTYLQTGSPREPELSKDPHLTSHRTLTHLMSAPGNSWGQSPLVGPRLAALAGHGHRGAVCISMEAVLISALQGYL